MPPDPSVCLLPLIGVHTLALAHSEVKAGRLEPEGLPGQKSIMLALLVLLVATVGGVAAAGNGTSRAGTKPHIVMFMMVS